MSLSRFLLQGRLKLSFTYSQNILSPIEPISLSSFALLQPKLSWLSEAIHKQRVHSIIDNIIVMAELFNIYSLLKQFLKISELKIGINKHIEIKVCPIYLMKK